MQLAIALYNNHVDDDDELEFRKGDILTVLIENPSGFDGWWLCQNHDRCGLCPGNRLKLIQNTESTPMKMNRFIDPRFSTASMYDSLSNHDYDNSYQSDFIANSKPLTSSPESSSRSSGIYSSNDLHLSSSSSSEFDPNITNNSTKAISSINLDQLERSFRKLSIRSSLIDKYRQLIFKPHIESSLHLFIIECQLFLENYGCLLDRSTYRLIKENLLYQFNHQKTQRIELSSRILQLIDQQLKQTPTNSSFIPNDVFKKLHLEPIEEIPHEKISTSHSSTQISAPPRTRMKTSKTCHSNFFSSSFYKKSNDYDYIDGDDDDYSLNPLIKCYYRHINEQIDSIMKRYSNSIENENRSSLLISEGKRLIVAGHKLVFVLETLHEHLQDIQTSLMLLTRQLCEALTNLIRLLKQFSQQNSSTIRPLIIRFKHDMKMILNIVKQIKRQCTL